MSPHHCERSEAIQLCRNKKAGLLRLACNLIAQSRNDDLGSILSCSRFDSGSDLCEEKNLQARRSDPFIPAGIDGLLRGARHRARIRATRWPAMTVARGCAWRRINNADRT